MVHPTRPGLAALAVLFATGCVAWRARDVTPQELLGDPRIEVVQVTLRDQSKQLVYQPKLSGDTLTGHPSERAIERLAIPLSNVTSVATKRTHLGKTLLAGLAVIGGVALYELLQSLNAVQ